MRWQDFALRKYPLLDAESIILVNMAFAYFPFYSNVAQINRLQVLVSYHLS